MALWTKAYVSFAGAPYEWTGFAVVRGSTLSPGESTTANLGFLRSTPVPTSAAVVPWTVGIQLHYAPNADLFDTYPGGVALDFLVQRNMVCAP